MTPVRPRRDPGWVLIGVSSGSRVVPPRSHRYLPVVSLGSPCGLPEVLLGSCTGLAGVSPVCPCGHVYLSGVVPGLTMLSCVPHQGLTPGSHRGFAGVPPGSLSHWDLGCRSPRMLATCFNAAVVPRPPFLNKFTQWLKVNLCACVRCSPLGERCFDLVCANV